ncbi:MAG: alpha/beta fold hydrolase [Myxococcota bacterium]
MILRSETVEQIIDGAWRGTFVKDVVMTPGQPIGMVRKRRAGGGPTRGVVLLVHGFGQNRYAWHISRRSFSAYLAERGWDVFNVDLRGHGRSIAFDGKRPEVLDEYIHEDVPACVDEALRLGGHDEVVLVGHSMGGIVSYCAAATALKGRVRAIASIGSPYRFGEGHAALKLLRTALHAARATGALDSNPYLPMRWLGRHLKRRKRLWDSPLLPAPVRAWRPGAVEDEVLDEYLAAAFEPTHLGIAFDILAGGDRIVLRSGDGALDYGAAFEALDVPLMVVAGDVDDLAPPASVKPAFERSGSTDKHFRVFPLGHADLIIGREAPTTVWPAIGDFLEAR